MFDLDMIRAAVDIVAFIGKDETLTQRSVRMARFGWRRTRRFGRGFVLG